MNYIHSLRAIAIFLVVAGHSLFLVDRNDALWQERLIRSVMVNGTFLFVFVAGFLFQHLAYKFEYQSYLKSKLRNVLLPYVIVSVPMIFAKAWTHRGIFDPANDHHGSTIAHNVIWSLLTGHDIVIAFWFIPMIAIFYMLAPVWLWIDRHPRSYYVLPAFIGITIFVHRPGDLDHVWHSSAYFAPIYLYGMWFSRYREQVLAWHERWLPHLMLALVAVIWIEVGYLQRAGHIGSQSMFSGESGIVGTNAIQKLLLCGILMATLRRAGNAIHRKLRLVADTSFGIYFLHMYFISAYAQLAPRITGPWMGAWATSAGAGILMLSVATLWLAKQMLGNRSRMIVGC